METEILEAEIELVTRNLWAMTLGMSISRKESARSAGALQDEVQSSVEIRGAWNGRIELHLSQTLANRITHIMFEGLPERITAYHREDALRELANITGGNVKNVLPTPTELSLPVVEPVSSSGDADSDSLVLEMQFESESEPYYVRVYRA